MEYKINIDDDKLTDFSNSALSTLKNHITKYASDIIDEANRIGDGAREDNAKKEVVSSYVERACIKYRYFVKKKESRWFLIKKIVSDVFLTASGILGSLAFSPDTNSRLLFISFCLCCAIAVAFTISKYEN